MTASLGGFSLISSLFKRPPIRLENRRRYLFPVPFIGLLLLTWAMIGDAPEFVSSIGWFLAILPGPLYIHLSYAPRWRMLDRIDRGLDPFDGMKITIAPDNSLDPDELDDEDQTKLSQKHRLDAKLVKFDVIHLSDCYEVIF